jgi:Dimethlysulfonioproprionate lyase
MTLSEHAIPQLVSEIYRCLGSFDLKGVGDVRAGIARWAKPPLRPVEPHMQSACSHLAVAVELVQDRKLAESIDAASSLLQWTQYDAYPRAEVGEAFADGHAFASIIGEDAFYQAEDFDLGLFIIAPGIFYPDHHHAAPELYLPLTGPHAWRFLPGQEFEWLNANVPVWNEPWAPHATRTGTAPFLSIYCWTRDVNLPAQIIPAGTT